MNAIFLEGQKMEPYYYVRDCNSHQRLLPMHYKMKQITIIILIIPICCFISGLWAKSDGRLVSKHGISDGKNLMVSILHHCYKTDTIFAPSKNGISDTNVFTWIHFRSH